MSGVIVNVITVIVGTALGLLFGKAISERFRAIAFLAIGLATTIIGASMSIGGLEQMGETEMGDYALLVFVGALIDRFAHRAKRCGSSTGSSDSDSSCKTCRTGCPGSLRCPRAPRTSPARRAARWSRAS